MEENAIQTEKKPIIKRGAKGYFLEGTMAGPGRPKGSKSIKDAVRKYLEENPEDFEEFVEHFIKKNRELAWQMLEGKPSQPVQASGDFKHFHITIGDEEGSKISDTDKSLSTSSEPEDNPAG